MALTGWVTVRRREEREDAIMIKCLSTEQEESNLRLDAGVVQAPLPCPVEEEMV